MRFAALESGSAALGAGAPMPLFYFDYTDDDGHHRDNEGSDLPSFEKAHDLALGKLPDDLHAPACVPVNVASSASPCEVKRARRSIERQ